MTKASSFEGCHDRVMHGRKVLVAGLFVLVARCDAADTFGTIPSPPDGGIASDDVSTFAIQTLFLGESRTDGGPPSKTAWRDLGYNLDGLITTATSTDVCILAPNTPLTQQLDGENGIDNAWGAVLLPITQTAFTASTPSLDVSKIIDSGGWTLQFQVTGLTNDLKESALGLAAQVFVSGATASPPAFDPSTDWPVLPSSLADGTTISGGARVQFSNVYVTNGTVVAEGASQPLDVPLVMAFRVCIVSCSDPGTPLSLPIRIHDPKVTFARTSSNTARGVIAGVLDTQELTDTFRRFAGRVSLSLCGSAFDGIALQLAQAQDILQDGTNAAGVPCNAISIGLGFVAKLVANPTKIGVDVPAPDPCDAGTD